jgi:ribose transport system substrate-binding protein
MRRTNTLLVGALLVVASSLPISACVRSDANVRPAVAVIPDEFWKAIHAGAVKAGRELGMDILWQGPIRSDDRSAQIDVVESMIVRRVKGIVLAPNDDTALRGCVEDAHRSGIPVVVVDSGLNSDKQVSFIATNNYEGGVMAGECLAKLIGGKGKVAMLRNIEGNESTENRERGFLDAIKKFPDIQLVSSNQHGGGTSEAAYRASENILAPLKKGDALALDGIFCSCEYTVFGMLRALQDGGLAGKVKFVGFDASKKINEALLKGDIDALVVQNPMKMGYLGVYAIADHNAGKKLTRQVDVDATLVTRENYKEPQIQELVNPPIKELLQ